MSALLDLLNAIPVEKYNGLRMAIESGVVTKEEMRTALGIDAAIQADQQAQH